MSNHESFLKMIGMNAEDSATNSITEEAATESLEEKSFSRSFVFSDEAGEETFDPVVEATVSRAVQTQTHSEVEGNRITKTEILDDQIIERTEIGTFAQPFTSEEEIEKTQNLSFADAVEAENAPPVNSQEFDDAENLKNEFETQDWESKDEDVLIEPSSDHSLRVLTKSRGTAGTRPTKALSTVDESESQNRTIHFDYDQDQGHSRIVILDGKVNAQAFHLTKLPLRIGRESDNDVVIEDSNVSRFHAEIQQRDLDLVIVDLKSANGVKVNGALISEKILQCHDVIQIGDALIEFLSPGVLSRGIPQSVVSETAPGAGIRTRWSRRAKIVFAATSTLLLGVIYLGTKKDEIKEIATDKFVEQAQTEAVQWRGEIEEHFQKDYIEIPAEAVKGRFLERLKASSIYNYLPLEMRNSLEQIPADILKIILEDPSLISDFAKNGLTEDKIIDALQRKLVELLRANRNEEALKITDQLLLKRPSDENLLKSKRELEEKLGRGSANSVIEEGGQFELEPYEKKFYEYMDTYNRLVEETLSNQQIDDALRVSKLVKEKILELLAKDAHFERVGRREIQIWDDKIKSIEEMKAAHQGKILEEQGRRARSEATLARIQALLNMSHLKEAHKLMDQFLKEDPQNPRANDVRSMRSELMAMISAAKEKTGERIEQFIQSETFEAAWQEFYRFIDAIPDGLYTADLHEKLTRATQPRAVQFYNQARVFEFEADDLVAAEQYYKRAVEAADPRGDLSKKASRRYAEVRRKNVR